jgi:hypothetical protein
VFLVRYELNFKYIISTVVQKQPHIEAGPQFGPAAQMLALTEREWPTDRGRNVIFT